MASLFDVRENALRLFREHGLDTKGWTFGFDNAKRRFGQCSSGAKRITISKNLAALNTLERVTQTIKHEIAHALAGPVGHARGWKIIAMRIGCPPVRCYSAAETETPNAPYEAKCPGCGTVAKKFKRPRRQSSCGRCSPRFDARYLLTFFDVRGINRSR